MPNIVLFIGFWVALTIVVVVFVKKGQKNRSINDRLLLIMSGRMRWSGRELAEACEGFLKLGQIYARLEYLERSGFVASRQEVPTRTRNDGTTVPGRNMFSLTEEGHQRVEKSRLQASR